MNEFAQPGPTSFNRLGPFYRMQRSLGLLSDGDLAAGRRALLYVVVSWLPVVLLAAIQGHAFNDDPERAVLLDFRAYSYAIAIFAFVLMEQASETRMAMLVGQFVAMGIITPDSRDRFAQIRRSMERRTGSALVEVVVLIAAYAVTYATLKHAGTIEASTWIGEVTNDSLQLTLAGWWAALVTLPLFWFLLGRWLWRFITWGALLRDLARCDLKLVATHADRCGGLAFIGQYPNTYLLFTFALSTVVAGSVLRHVVYAGVDPMTFKFGVIAMVVFLAVAFIAPLAAFTPALIGLKRSGLRRYSVLVTHHNLAFEEKWIDVPRLEGESPLGSPDVSSLADLAAGYEMVKNIRPLPVTRETVAPLIIAAALPFIAVALTQLPVKQVLDAVKGLLVL